MYYVSTYHDVMVVCYRRNNGPDKLDRDAVPFDRSNRAKKGC